MSLDEYEKLKRQAVPTYYLSGKESNELVEEGLKEYREGKTKEIKSLSDLD